MLTYLTVFYLQGVSTGFQSDIPPSNCFGANDKPPLPETPLSVRLANWQSADIDPEVIRNLVQEEINQGWVFEFEGGIEEAKDCSPAVAVGRLGVAYLGSRPPRLVVFCLWSRRTLPHSRTNNLADSQGRHSMLSSSWK